MTMPPEQTTPETPSITPDGDVSSVAYPDGSHPESDFQPRTEVAPEKSEKKSGSWTRGKIISGIAIASVLGIAGGTAAVLTPQSQSAPEVPVDPTETPTISPSPEVTQSPKAEFTVQSLEIPTGLDSEALGKALIEDRITKWLNAGANQETMTLWINYSGTLDEFVPTIVDPNTEIIRKALFIEDYKNSPLDSNIDGVIDGISIVNSIVIKNYIATVASDNPNNKEAYRQWYTVDSVNELKSNTPGSRNLVINYTEHSNSDKNIAKPLPITTGYYKITVQDDGNGHEKISAIELDAR
ncbi:MAG: hypothetical protein KF692_00675 [Cryobacterium sp.]|nr:hypothetical protein [Cryobacterium sp.]